MYELRSSSSMRMGTTVLAKGSIGRRSWGRQAGGSVQLTRPTRVSCDRDREDRMWWWTVTAALATDPAIALQAGIDAAKAGDLRGARTHYEACLAADARAVGCHWELGWLAWKSNDWPAVVRHWK